MEALTVLLIVLPVALSSPVNWRTSNDAYTRGRQCSLHCTGSNRFQYDVGKTYEYTYEVVSHTSMHGASEDVAKIHAGAVASIQVVSKCEMSLSLSKVTIRRSDPESPHLQIVNDWEFKSALESNPLLFSFQDGLVEELCPEDDEDVQALNFKRGVLSAFQNSMNQHEKDESLQEVDVAGACPTKYTVTQKGWESSQFKKSKDLLGCMDRNRFRTTIQSSPFRLPDAIQSLPLLKGNHECTQSKAREGHTTKSTCTESLVFRPFSKKESGARSETIQKLKHSRTINGISRSNPSVSKRTILLFQHEGSEGSSEQTLWSAREKLAELCRITVHDLPAEVPALFTDMIYLMRDLDGSEFMDIAERVQRGDICNGNTEKARKFFYDALPMVGTDASVQVMVELLLSGEVTGVESDLWLTSLQFLHHPTMKMVVDSRRLLISEKLRMSALLPVTSLVNNVCKKQTNCASDKNVADVIAVLSDILGQTCQSSSKELILLALRAAGNLGHSDKLAPTLSRCAEYSQNDMVIRVFAAQAFRGVTCKADRQALRDIFLNKNEDSELRIAAYLGIMRCADEATIKEVKFFLEHETVNQVGSFVWTHLTNLMQTPRQHKQALKAILEDETLAKEFNMDRRKYSRNYELAYFSDKFGSGIFAESDLIWSSKSFLPRSAMLNLTVDVFGQSVNLMEAGGRVEGVEQFMQNYLSSSQFFKGGEKRSPGPLSRCVKPQKMDKMKDTFAVQKDDLSASLYFRVFGKELGFRHFTENDILALKEKTTPKDILSMLAKGQDIAFTKSVLFMDSSVTVPTAAGMSLTLSANGTASVDIQASTKMDLRKFSLKKMEAMFDIRPSGAVHVSGLMSLKMGSVKAGLKMITTLHTSTAMSGSLDLTNGQVLTVEADTPKQIMNILDVKSDFFVIHDQVDKKQDMIRGRKVNRYTCTSQKALQVLGYELCGAVSFINSTDLHEAPYFPFAGPTMISVVLSKKDAPRGYKLVGKYIKNAATAIGHLSIDTLGSAEDRALSIGYFVDKQARSVEIELTSPWKNMLLKGSYTKKDGTSGVFSALARDDGQEYNINLKYDKDAQKKKTVWTTDLELLRPQDVPKFLEVTPKKFTVKGTLDVSKDLEEVTADIAINTGLKPEAIDVTANYINSKEQKTLAGTLTFNKNKKAAYSATVQLMTSFTGKKQNAGKLEPTILISLPHWRPLVLSGAIDFRQERLLKGNLHLTSDRYLKAPFELTFKITKQAKKTTDRYRGQGKLTSEFITVKTNGFVNAATKVDPKVPLISTKIKTDYNIPILKNRALRKNRVTLSSKLRNRSTKTLTKYDLNLNFDSKNYPDANFISNLEFNHKDAFTKAEMTFRHGAKAKFVKDKTRELKVGMEVTHKIEEKAADIRYDVHIIYPKMDIEYQLNGKHEHQNKNKFWFETYLTTIYAKGKPVEFRLSGRDESKKNTKEASGALELSFPSFKTLEGKQVQGRRYKINTAVKKNARKDYVFTLNTDKDGKPIQTLMTTYKKVKTDGFDVSSTLTLELMEPVSLSVQATHDSDKMISTSMNLKLGRRQFSSVLSAEQDGRIYRNNWDISWPERRVKGSLEGGQKQEGEAILKFTTFWDADKDPSQRIKSDFYYLYRDGKNKKQNLQLSLETPFEGHREYMYKRLVEVNDKELKDEFKIVYRQPRNEYSYSLWILLPPSIEKFEMKASLVTPYDALRKLNGEVVHKFGGSRYISTTLKGAYNEHTLMADFSGSNKGNKIRNDLEGSLTITSTIPQSQNVFIQFKHNDDGREFSSEVEYTRDSNRYKAVMDTTWMKVHYQTNVNAKLELYLPNERPITVKWDHSNTLTDLNSTLSLSWKPEYDSKLIVGAKGSKAEERYAVDIALSVPFKEFKDLDLQLRYNARPGYSGSANWRFNKDTRLEGWATFKYTQSDLEFDFKSHINHAMLKTQYGSFPYTVVFDSTWPMRQRDRLENVNMVLEASVSENEYQGWTANVKLSTPWDAAKRVDASGNVVRISETEWTADSTISYGVRKQITVDINIDTKDYSKMYLMISTPFEQMDMFSIGVSQSLTSNSGEMEVHLELIPLFNKKSLALSYNLEPKFVSRLRFDDPDREFKFIEVNVENQEQRRGYNTDVKLNYHPNKEVELKFKGRFNKNKFPDHTKAHLSLTTPYDILPYLDVKTNVGKEEGKWVGEFDLKSGAQELEHLKVGVKHSSSDSSCNTDLEVESSVFETVLAGAHFDWGEMAGANVSLLAPSVGRTMLGFKRNSKSWNDFRNKIFAEFNGDEVDLDVGFKHDDSQTRGWVVYVLPGSKHSYIKAFAHREGSAWNDFDVGTFLQIGRDSKPFNVSAQLAYTDTKYAIGTTFETPRTKHLSYLGKGETTSDGMKKAVAYIKYGKKYQFSSSASYRFTESSLHYSVNQDHIIDGKTAKTSELLDVKWSEDELEVLYHSSSNENWMKFEMTRNAAPEFGLRGTETIDASLMTSFKDFEDVGLHARMDSKSKKNEGIIRLEYMDGQEAVLTFDIARPNKNKATLDATLTTPVDDYKKNQITYEHTITPNKIVATSEVVTGRGKHINGNFELKNKEEFTFNIIGPIEEFESFKVSGKYNDLQKQVIGDAELRLSLHSRPARLDFDIITNNQPITIDLKLRSPYENARKADFTILHNGVDWKQFTTTALLTSEAIGTVRSETSWKFDSERDMNLKSTFTSKLENMEDLKLEFSTEEGRNKQKSKLTFGWGPDKEIVVNNDWSFNQYNEQVQLNTNFDMTTPFDELKVLDIKMSHSTFPGSVTQNVFAHHNGRTYMDADFEYTYDDKHEGNLDIRSPRPMSFFITGTGDENTFDGKIIFNWDKRSPEGRIEIVSSLADRSNVNTIDKEFKLKAIHPVRIMGVDCLYKQTETEFTSSGLITWDQHNGNTFLYDLGYGDKSSRYNRKYESHVKLGVPQRIIKLQGSYGDTDNTITTNTALFWDAGKDDRKKVEMTTTVENKDSINKVGLKVNVPYINRQMNIAASTKGGYGSNLIDSRADISYSSDPRKTLTVTYTVSNTEFASSDNYNYTAQFGLVHPITGIDVMLLSHIGKVSKSCTLGSAFSFLSADNNRKSLAFYAKGDGDNNKMEIRVSSPTKTMELHGQLDDLGRQRQGLSAASFIDGRQARKVNFVVDHRRRSVDLEMNYDEDSPSKALRFTGRLVNDSAMQVDLISQDGRDERVESMVAVRLNSSNLLHTRILWRPSMLHDAQQYVIGKLTEFSYQSNDAFSASVDSMEKEVKAKYHLVSQELRSEMSQVFSLMDKEMDDFSVQLETLRREFRRFYQRNDLHIKELGEPLKAAFEDICDSIRDLVQDYRAYYTGITRATNDWLLNLKSYPIAQNYRIVIQDLTTGLRSIRQALEETLDVVTIELEKFSELTYRKYLEVSRAIDRKLDSYSRSIYELAMYQRMIEQKAMLERISGAEVSKWAKVYDHLYINGQQLLQDQFHDVMLRPEFQHMHAVASELHQQLMHWNQDGSVDMLARRITEMSKNLILMELTKLKRMLMDLDRSRVIVYDPRRGELQFELYMPVAIKSFTEAPELNLSKYINKVKKMLSPTSTTTNSSVWDYYYDYVPSLEPSDWVPPFDGSAYLIGSQHFMTFDSHEYDFLSSCSHVLARDVMHDNFSVVVNYDKRPRNQGVRSLCFTFGDLTLEVSDDYRVQVNRQDTEMPFISETVKVTREGEVIRVQYYGGIEVIADPSIDLYKITVDGWYHGRIAGLLGKYDNEPSNDIVTDRLTNDLEVKRGSCNPDNVAWNPDPSRDVNKACNKVFEDQNSKFRPCYKQVDPSSFLRMCQVYMNRMTEKEALYLSSEQYRFVCRDKGVYMGPLPDVAKCSDQKQPFEIVASNPAYHSADVVFVVEDNKCNQWATSSLATMVQEIDKQLTTAGMKDNRFGLESFGGVEPDSISTRTMFGQHFGEDTVFLKAVETLKFQSHEGNGDVAKAILDAADYPFRTGVAKVLIVAPCSGGRSRSGLDRSMVSQVVLKGFTVHVLQEKGYLYSVENSPRKYEIYGTNGNEVFTNQGSGAKIPFDVIQEDKPSCWDDVAFETGGNVYDTTHLSSRGRTQREFIESFAHKVGWSTKLPECQVCACNANFGRTECQPCESYNTIIPPVALPNLPQMMGSLHDAGYQIKSYLGY